MEKLIDCSLEFIEEISENEAFASVTLNPSFQWVKIIVTDDKPNGNKQRIPLEEFDNLIKTGIHSPIKMQPGKISDGHTEAFGHPIGTITALQKTEDRVEALAALWKKERPEDIASLKDMYTKGTPPNVSWEISYSDSESDENGILTLKGTSLNGLCVVGLPAYAGRTPFVAMASEKDDNNKETDTVELEELQTKITELETNLQSKIAELEAVKVEKDALAEFKNNIEKLAQDAEKMASIKQKFVDAKIEKEDDYFNTNKDRFLSMSAEDLDFLVQELVSFAPKKESTSSVIPNLNGGGADKLSPAELAKALRELKSTK
jgi:plasmid maintenance system killer protein